jgi:hypothetical protein
MAVNCYSRRWFCADRIKIRSVNNFVSIHRINSHISNLVAAIHTLVIRSGKFTCCNDESKWCMVPSNLSVFLVVYLPIRFYMKLSQKCLLTQPARGGSISFCWCLVLNPRNTEVFLRFKTRPRRELEPKSYF